VIALPTDSLRKALANRKAAATALAEQDDRVAALDAEALAWENKAEEARAARLDHEAAALLGETVGMPVTDEAERMAEQKAKAAHHAATRLQGGRAVCTARLVSAEAEVVVVTLAHTITERDEAHRAVVTGLHAIAGPLADLVAADLLRERLVGRRFTIHPRDIDPAALWSGAHAVRAFVAALPERLRAGLTIEEIECEADRRATALLGTLEESK
jgi:hypothetical protein